jgi:hypothetical protein
VSSLPENRSIGKFVPDIGTLTFYRPVDYRHLGLGFKVYSHNQCHRKGPNSYSEHGYALFPYYTGQVDDPQYQEYKIGSAAFENEADAIRQAIKWSEEFLADTQETITKVEENIAEMRLNLGSLT